MTERFTVQTLRPIGIIVFILCFLLILGVDTISGATIYVCTDGTCGNYNCDGTDDNVQIQWAVDNASTNDIIQLNASDYVWDLTSNNQVILNSMNNITITGGTTNPADTVCKNETASYTNMVHEMFILENCANITFQYLTFTSGMAVKPVGGTISYAINASMSNDTTFTHNAVSGMNGFDIHLVTWTPSPNQISYRTRIDNSTFSKGRIAIFYWGTYYSSIEDCTFELYNGNGVYFNAHVKYSYMENVTMTSCDNAFEIYSSCDSNSFLNSSISNAGGSNGAIRLYSSNTNSVIRNCTLDNNKYGIKIETRTSGPNNFVIERVKITDSWLDGITVVNNGGSSGGGIFDRCVIHGNTQNGIYFSSAIPSAYAFTLKNMIITNNEDTGIDNSGTSATINLDYSDVWNNTVNYNGAISGGNNISSNPSFYDVQAEDFHLNSTTGTWNGASWEAMSTNSPCIDAGNPADGYSNEPSPNGGRVNMGAFGNTIYASKSVGEDAYIPPDPTNLQNTSGNYWANYTWAAGSGNVTDSYNVWNETIWNNGTSNTYLNESIGASNWLNITVYAWNSSGGGTLSAGSVSDQVQTSSADTYIPPNPITLQNTTGNYWVNYTWSAGSGNITNSYNISNETGWSNGSSDAYFYESVGVSGWLNITVYAWNSSGIGTLSIGNVSDQVQAPAATYNYIYTGANEWCLFNNWSSALQTFSQIAANESNDLAYSYYNSTSGLWESYWVGYSINQDNSIPKNESLLGYFNAATIITCDILSVENVAIPANVWFYTYLRENTNYNLTQINASIVSDGCVVSAIYGFQNGTQAYNSTGSYIVKPNEGFALYVTTGCNWDGGV